MGKRLDVLNQLTTDLLGIASVNLVTGKHQLWESVKQRDLDAVFYQVEDVDVEQTAYPATTAAGDDDMQATLHVAVRAMTFNRSGETSAALENLKVNVEKTISTSTGLAALLINMTPVSFSEPGQVQDNYAFMGGTFDLSYAYNHANP